MKNMKWFYSKTRCLRFAFSKAMEYGEATIYVDGRKFVIMEVID